MVYWVHSDCDKQLLSLQVFVVTCLCRARWTLLQDLILSRSKKLSGAYEIHKFNRDAKELLGRLQVSPCHVYVDWIIQHSFHLCVLSWLINSLMWQQDKECSIPCEDLGRSVATVVVLQKKHEVFEREVVVLGNKVLVLFLLSCTEDANMYIHYMNVPVYLILYI